MPMRLSRRHMDHIADLQTPGCFTFRANETRAHGDSEDLTALVRVPERACAWCEADVVAHAVVCREDRVHVYCACEGFRGLL